MKQLLIFGANNFAQAAHYYFENDSDYKVTAFVVDAEFLKAETFLGLPVVAFEDVQERFPPDDFEMFLAMGLRNVNRLRAAKLDDIVARDYRLASYVSSRAVVPVGLEVQPNTWIMEQAHVHPYATIGRNTIIWSRSTIGFKSNIGEHCWISGGLVGDSVTVGGGTFLGLGSTVASFVNVGRHNLIGAGALILKDTGADEIYRGIGSEPSRVPSHRFSSFNG